MGEGRGKSLQYFNESIGEHRSTEGCVIFCIHLVAAQSSILCK